MQRRVLGGSLTRAPISHECGLFTLTLTGGKSEYFAFASSWPFGLWGCSGLGLALVVVKRLGPSARTFSLPQALTLNPCALLGPAPSVAFGNTGAHGNRYRNPIVGAPVDKACY